VKHPVLFGEFELSIDDKNRLLIPSEVRRSIDQAAQGDGFFLVVGVNRHPWLYPERYYEQLVTEVPADITPEQDLLAFDQLHFALASRLDPDKQGRVVLPDKILRRVGIEREVTLIGVRDHLELWNRTDWEVHREALEQRAAEVAVTAKRRRQGQEPAPAAVQSESAQRGGVMERPTP